MTMGYQATNFGAIQQLNHMDRILSYFAGTKSRAVIGEMYEQGEHISHYFYVNSVRGSDGNDGSDPRLPLATLEEALGRCTADREDVIWILPGHSETLTADLLLSVAGVTIIGMGSGSRRPTFTVGDAVGEAVNVTGARTTVENCIFICGTDAQTAIMNIKAVDVTIKDCDFREVVTTKQPLSCIDIGGGGAANTCDRASIIGCNFKCPTAGDGDQGVYLSEVNDEVHIIGCNFYGDWDVAPIHNPTGKVLTQLLVMDCMLVNLLTGQLALELVSACTGNLIRNFYATDVAGIGGVDPGSCRSFECFACDAIDVSGALAPTITT